MRLCVAVLCALLAAAAAQPDTEDLPPVDQMVERVLTGQLKPQDLVDMTPRMPPQYLQDVKNGLPDHLKQKIAELAHARAETQAAVEPEPAGEEEEDYTDDYEEEVQEPEEEDDYTDDYEEEEVQEPEEAEEDYYYEEEVEEPTEDDEVEEPIEEEPAEEDQEPELELAPVEEPIEEEQHSGMLRAGPVLRAGTMEESGMGTGGSGRSGVSEGQCR